MNRKVIILSVLLALSISGNVHLLISGNKWKNAWLNQFLATEEIEQILKASGGDTSFEFIRKIAEKRYSRYDVEVIEMPEVYLSMGLDKNGIKINKTILLFKNGLYYGSKADLPNH